MGWFICYLPDTTTIIIIIMTWLSYEALPAHFALLVRLSVAQSRYRFCISLARENEDRMTGMSQFTSYGICALCGKRTTKAAMTRHLGQCLAEHETSQGKSARLFRLRIEDAFSPIFWIDVEIKANATLEELDDFLRQRWLECCAHLSAFYIEGDTYMVSRGMEPGGPFVIPANIA